MGFDLSAKTVRAVGMLALQMQTDGRQFLRGYRVHDQGAVAPLAFNRIGGQRTISVKAVVRVDFPPFGSEQGRRVGFQPTAMKLDAP